MEKRTAMVAGRKCSPMVRKSLHYGSSTLYSSKKSRVLKKIKVDDFQSRECSGFDDGSSNTRLHIPENLVFEILVRLPAKSVARFRCVSTAWLSMTTDPSFILAHARRAPKSLLVTVFNNQSLCIFQTLFFSFSLRGFTCFNRRLDQISDLPMSSLDGLVVFSRYKPYCLPMYYVINHLSGLRIDLPPLLRRRRAVKTIDLYYHRWTGEYRLLNLNRSIDGSYFCNLDVDVMSLGDATSSWRQIKTKLPIHDFSHWHRRLQVNDCLYWICRDFIDTPTIIVFDILNETFSFMELPSYSQYSTFPSFTSYSCLNYGLDDMEGILYLWCVYRGKSCAKNVMIDIWTASEGEEKWKNTYSLCLVDEWNWALKFSHQKYRLVDCFCLKEKELMFFFDGQKTCHLNGKTEEFGEYAQYLFHWNLKSGKYRTERISSGFEVSSLALICKETLITAPLNHTI